jgi:hypothetical protein
MHEAEHAFEVPARMSNIRVQQCVVETLRMYYQKLAPKRSGTLTALIGQQASAKRLPDERRGEHPELKWNSAGYASGRADEHKPGDAIRGIEREGDRPQPTERVGHDSNGAQLKRGQDIAEKGARMVEWIYTGVVKWIR